MIPPPLLVRLSARTPESGGIRLCKSEMSNNSYIQMGMDMKGNMFAFKKIIVHNQIRGRSELYLNVHFEKIA